MKKILSILLLLIPLISVAASPSAPEVVDKTVQNISGSGSVTALYSLKSTSASASGSIELSRNRFVLTSGEGNNETIIWYDGKTMWAYSASANEVTITEPDENELTEINPLELLKSVKTGYTAKMVKQSSEQCTVSLLPKKKQNITSAQLTVDLSTYLLKNISLTINKQPVTINILSIKKGKALPEAYFRFPSNRFPKAEINDLR